MRISTSPIVFTLLIVCTLQSCLNAAYATTKTDSSATFSIKPTADFDQRFYYCSNLRMNVWGYRGGFLLYEKYKAGIGVYYLNQTNTFPAGSTIAELHQISNAITVQQLNYIGTLYLEPFLFRRALFESSILIESGYGKITNRIRNPVAPYQEAIENGHFLPLGVGLSVNFKFPPLFGFVPLRWFGINLIGGYRTAINDNLNSLNYNGAYWSLSGAIFLDRFEDDFKAFIRKRKANRRI